MLNNEDDIRVVVGFHAEKVIEVVKNSRKDVLFVFNHDYKTTGTGASVALAAKYANEYVLSLDGDLLVHPDDMQKILECEHEFVSRNEPMTDDPWMLQTYTEEDKRFVSAFSKCMGIMNGMILHK